MRDPVFTGPKPQACLKLTTIVLPNRRYLLALSGRKQTVFRHHLSTPNLPGCGCDYLAQGFSTHFARGRLNWPPPLPNLVFTHTIERVAVRLCLWWRPTRLSTMVSPASRVPQSPDGNQNQASHTTKLGPRFNEPAYG